MRESRAHRGDPGLSALYAIVAVFVASVLYVHFRGRERLSVMRQLADHSTFTAPYTVFVNLFSALPRRPMLDVADLPELAVLREHWQTIRDEALALERAGAIRKSERYDDLAFNSFFKRDWTRFYCKWYGDVLPSARASCPQTVALLERVPSVHAAMFAVLAPHSKLVRHRDPFAGSLRYHLGLRTPNADVCRIFVDREPYVWRDGEDVLFDETYLHRAENRSDQARIILFCDVERPLRTRAARACNRWVIRTVMPATRTRNLDGDPIGVANRIFSWVYRIRVVAKALKRHSRGTYYALSYGAKLAPVAALLYFLWRG